jgi:hypothetical protein
MTYATLEERYQDRRNIRIIGNQTTLLTFEIEVRLLRGVNVRKAPCKSPGFFQGIYPNHTVLSSTDPNIWGEENFDPNGYPYGDEKDPSRECFAQEPICDMHGHIIDGEWSDADQRLLEDEIAEEELEFEIFCEELEKRRKRKPKSRRRNSMTSRVNMKTAQKVVF